MPCALCARRPWFPAAGCSKIGVVKRSLAGFTLVAALLAGTAGVARADEAKTPVSAAFILDIVSAPVTASRQSAFDASLKEPGKPRDIAKDGEVLPDGSVKYGRTVITVKNPCPPGEHFEMPLPGRRR